MRCIAWMRTYPFTTFGTYNEAIMLVRVDFGGEAYNYCPFIYVDAEAPMAAGKRSVSVNSIATATFGCTTTSFPPPPI